VSDLIAFWAARLDEDEADASEAAENDGPDWQLWDGRNGGVGAHGMDPACDLYADVGPHVARHDPARGLREVEADRRLLAEAESLAGDIGWDDAIMLAVKLRVSAWSDHPDYRAEECRVARLMIRRLALIGMVALVVLPFVAIALGAGLWAFVHWLRAGPDTARTDRILFNPVLDWLADLPFRVTGIPCR
jgi:hypothetical protein